MFINICYNMFSKVCCNKFIKEVCYNMFTKVCYGMIYGIGPHALAEQLSVDDNEASIFTETFKAKYTGICSDF